MVNEDSTRVCLTLGIGNRGFSREGNNEREIFIFNSRVVRRRARWMKFPREETRWSRRAAIRLDVNEGSTRVCLTLGIENEGLLCWKRINVELLAEACASESASWFWDTLYIQLGETPLYLFQHCEKMLEARRVRPYRARRGPWKSVDTKLNEIMDPFRFAETRARVATSLQSSTLAALTRYLAQLSITFPTIFRHADAQILRDSLLVPLHSLKLPAVS